MLKPKKYMKNITIITLIILSVNQTFAQNKVEKNGPNIDKKETQYFTDILGHDKTSFYMLRSDLARVRASYGIEQFSKNSLIKTKQVALIKYNKFTVFQGSLFIKNKIYLFSKQYNIPDKKAELIVDEFDADKVNTESKRTIIMQYETDNSKWFQTSFMYFLSPDSTKIGFFSKYMDDLSFASYNLDGLKKISVKQIPNSSEGEKISVEHMKIDNQGNLIYLFYNKGNFNIIKQFITNEKNVQGKIKEKANTELQSLKMLIDSKSNTIFVYGMFYDKNENEKIKGFQNGGIYISKLDYNTLAIISEKYNYFTKDIINKLTCENPKASLGYYSPSITLLNNSDILFESISNSTASQSRGSGTSGYDMSQKVYYFANEIIVSNLKQNLELNWMQLIPRSITYTNITDNTESTIEYTKFINENNVKYLFIEHPKFEEKKINFSTTNTCDIPNIKSYIKSNLVTYNIDFNGKISKQIVYFNEENWLIPNSKIINSDESKYIMRFRKSDDESFGVLNLK